MSGDKSSITPEPASDRRALLGMLLALLLIGLGAALLIGVGLAAILWVVVSFTGG